MSEAMATQIDRLTPVPQIVDIRHLSGRELDPLLLEEAIEWNLELDCDFSRFAGRIRKLADAGNLRGAALLHGGEVAGYGCTVLEDHKGLIADVYVRPDWRDGHGEATLFRVLLYALIGVAGVRRVESQLMLLSEDSARALGREPFVRLFERLLMKLDADTPLPPGRASTERRFRIDPWNDRHHDAAATALSLAHAEHIDSQINDQYGTLDGARCLATNIVRFPGFSPPASSIAFDSTTGSVAGMVLSSFVARDVAEITELCVTPDARGAGLGYEVLRQSIGTLRGEGAKRISLAVTAANEDAVRLYIRCGFHMARRFYAYVWENLDPRRPPAVD
jgi:ribosomal protein S18 acetylase RimI-like enzyme